jgi:hypothetical protein
VEILVTPPASASAGRFGRSLRRIVVAVLIVSALALIAYALWQPGLNVTDGRHDRGSNAVWLAHGWLGADEWFVRNNKTNELAKYRSLSNINALAEKLRRHRITDVFPHLCPAEPTGKLPPVSREQVEQFLNVFDGFRVVPWIGGPNGASVRANNERWRATFVMSVQALLAEHPRFAGVHLNVEPLPSGDKDFLLLLDQVRAVLPSGKLLSVAAYPPPTRWHQFPDVHWDEAYFREVARRCDQVAVMMYDAAQKIPKTYQRLMVDWTVEVLTWSEDKSVLLGVPTYDDVGAGYHDPKVENLRNALLGIHGGLSRKSLPANYQGVAIYSDWETSDSEWRYFREHFLKTQ